MDSSLNKAQVKVQPRSGFDKSFMSVGSGRCGQIIPILCDEVLPNSKVSLKLAMNASLPPLANDIYMRCSIKTEAFFVPSRLLVGSYQNWFSGVGDDADNTPGKLPFISIEPGTAAGAQGVNGFMSSSWNLFDWLGFRVGSVNTASSAMEGISFPISMLPFLAYHKIYDDWYRRPLIQRPAFVRPIQGDQIGRFDCKFFPYTYVTENFSEAIIENRSDFNGDSFKLNDGHNVFVLRQRNFGDDVFTVAQPSPQLGPARVVSTAGNQFTIAALRAQNSMQEFEEFNQLAGTRFQDQLRVRYGASLSDGVAQRSLFLGSGTFDIYSKGVYQSNTDDAHLNTRNPYNSVGSRYGSAYASGQEFIISNFTANEPGYIFVMCTLVPRRSYGTAILPLLTKYAANVESAVMGNAVLQNVGNQPIYTSELGTVARVGIFGYQQRFSEYMYRNDEVHGELRRGGYLQHFALHDTFAENAEIEISTDFIQIPENYINTVFVVSPGDTMPHYWYDCYFDYRVSQPLAKFSIPSLQNPAYEHGETITVKRGGISL